jgi:hypothetical protein
VNHCNDDDDDDEDSMRMMLCAWPKIHFKFLCLKFLDNDDRSAPSKSGSASLPVFIYFCMCLTKR